MKKDGSVKFVLESRQLNKQVHKNKYQMPNIDELMDIVWRYCGMLSYNNGSDVCIQTITFEWKY